VLVVCDAPDVATQRVCQEQVAARIAAAGATPVISQNAGLTAGPPPTNDATLVAARGAGAKAIFGITVGADVTVVNPGPSIGIGVGGFGGSGGYRGGTVTGGSVGIGFPIGGGQATTGYAANMVLTDAATVKLMWSSKGDDARLVECHRADGRARARRRRGGARSGVLLGAQSRRNRFDRTNAPKSARCGSLYCLSLSSVQP